MLLQNVKHRLKTIAGSFFVPERDINRLAMVVAGHIHFENLYAAVSLDLFSLLSEKKKLTLKDISTELKIDEKPTRILLLGLVSTGLLKKRKEFYYNTKLAEISLTAHSPKNILSLVKWEHHIVYKPMFHYYESLLSNKNEGLSEFKGTEKTLYERLSHEPKLKKIFQDAMHDFSVQANEELVRSVNLSDRKFLVDIGGGDGTNVIAISRAFPKIKAAVFDLPTVCPISKKNIKKHGLSSRLKVIPGDCFKTPFPRNADCFLFSHFMTIWSEKKNQLLLKKAYEALPNGGKVLIFNMMQNDSGTGPLSAAAGSPYFLALATGEGMLYSWSEYRSWLRAAGFRNITQKSLPRNHGVIIGVKK